MKCVRCPNRARRGRRRCNRCSEIAARQQLEYRSAGRIPYTPIDFTLEHPTTRILRALCRFEYLHHNDLMDVLSVGVDRRDRGPYSSAAARLASAGMVTRQRRTDGGRTKIGNGHWYAITHAGRVDLARRLRVDMEACSDSEADLDAVIRVFGSLDVPALEAA